MVEGSFNKIIRHGDSPKNYWWEVTLRDGTIYSYGGYNEQVDDETSLTDGNGNRIKWALKRIPDVHGNFAAYHYTKSGNNLYPQKYTYMGFGNEEGLTVSNSTSIRPEEKMLYVMVVSVFFKPMNPY